MTGAPGSAALQVAGGATGVAARLDELDALAVALADAATDCASLAARAVTAAGDLDLGPALLVDPGAVATVLAGAAEAGGVLCRESGRLASTAAAVAATASAYRAREAAVETVLVGIPLVVAWRLRSLVGTWSLLLPGAVPVTVVAGAGAVQLARSAPAPVRSWVVDRVVAHPFAVDATVRVLPGVLGTADVATTARLLAGLGGATGLLRETPVRVEAVGGAVGGAVGEVVPCGEDGAADAVPGTPATGVAGLLRRGQSVASWREPAPGEHDTLPPGADRPERGQVRVDRVVGADGRVAWVVHVPGTQEWDGDGRGSPMDMAANVGLVAGTPTGVRRGVATAVVRAGVRPGEPVLLVGHSQGGMTATDLAADPGLRRVADVRAVVTAGSPVAGRTPPPGVTVLALEHRDDLVPRLDGRRAAPDRDRVVVVTDAPDGPWRTDAVPAHSSGAYVVTAGRVDASTDPSLVAVREDLAPFLAREGATCTTRQVVLTRTDRR